MLLRSLQPVNQWTTETLTDVNCNLFFFLFFLLFFLICKYMGERGLHWEMVGGKSCTAVRSIFFLKEPVFDVC